MINPGVPVQQAGKKRPVRRTGRALPKPGTTPLSALVLFIVLALAIPSLVSSASAAEHTVALTGAEFPTIQGAIDSSSPGDTITVESGTYPGNIRLTKTISLIGIDSGAGAPVIEVGKDGNGIEITANDCSVEGFVIQDSEFLSGIRISSAGNDISKNVLLNNAQGIVLISAAKNTISGNNITGNARFGITLQDADDNLIVDNSIIKDSVGIALDEVSGNNTIYRNNFVNPQNVLSKNLTTSWDSPDILSYAYLGIKNTGRMGNYWSDYHGRTDHNADGIGDSPYQILLSGAARPAFGESRDVLDSFPLMDPKEFYSNIMPSGTLNPGATPTASGTNVTPGQTPPIPTKTSQIVTTRPVTAGPSQGPGKIDGTGYGVVAVILGIIVVGGIGGTIVFLRRGGATTAEPPNEPAPKPVSPGDEQLAKSQATIHVPDAPAETAMTGPYTSAAEQKNYFPRELEAKYDDIEYVGRGGIAWVFSARRKTDEQKVAVKIPISFDEMTGRSFLNEIKAWETLRHPNIVEVSAVNILPVPYVEMEFVPGSLEAITKPVPVWKAVHIIRGIADALNYAHQHGFIHRDIKPHNVLLTENLVPKITDWGMSKVLAADVKHSSIAGFSLSYAAPEQVSPSEFGRTDERTDIYQLGVVFYELVTGTIPFGGESIVEVGNAIIRDQPIYPSEYNPDAVAVEKIILKCLAKDPAQRFQSAAEVLDALSRYLDEDEE